MPIQVFGQGAVQTAYVSYLPLDITANSLTLVWPTSYFDVPSTQAGIHYQALAASMNVTTDLANVHIITLPDARQTTVGANFIITNVGQSAFTLNKSDDTPLIVVPNTVQANSFWVQLTDNSTAAGTWYFIEFGAGTYSAQAAELAGYGLIADNRNKLNTNIPVTRINVPPVLDEANNAAIFVWTGAANTINLPAVGDVPAGYYLSFNNNGSGPITIRPSENPLGTKKIDGEDSLILGTGQTVTIISDGDNWWSLGLGLGDTNNFIVSPPRNVGPGGDFYLTEEESSFDAIDFTGALTSDVIVHLANIQRSWFLSNSTTGNFTLSVQLENTGTVYVISQGNPYQYVQQFFSTTTSLYAAPTSVQSFQVQGQVLPLDGDFNAPSYSFFSDQSTGMYYEPTTGNVAFTLGGSLTGFFAQAGGFGGINVISGDGSNFASLVANSTTSSIIFNNNLAITLDLSGNSTFSGHIRAINGTNSEPAYSFSSSTNSGIVFSSINNIIGLSITGTGLFSFQKFPALSAFIIISPDLLSQVSITKDNTSAAINYGGTPAIQISSAGIVTLPASGWNFPIAAAAGTFAYYDGTNWVILAPPAAGGAADAYLKITKATGVPFWSDT